MKRNYLTIVTLILISSLLLTPVQASITTYIWDNIHYVEGTSIDYPHPDRDYYDISISSDWTVTGTKLYHNQFNHDTSEWVAGVGIIGVCTLIGIAVGAMTGTAEGAAIGGVVGVVLGLIAAGAGVVLKDECGCIWFWVSISFVSWLSDNAWWLGPFLENPILAGIAIDAIGVAFALYGYLRIGNGTIYDAVGAGNPAPPPPPPSGGGCPILSVWNGTDYFEEGLLNIHNPEGIDVVYQHTLVSTPQSVNGAYLMRLTEHNQTHSYIDQVKLYAILEDGTMKKLPLIYAWHSEDGNVLPQLLFSDDWKTDTLGADHNNGTSQSIDLKFASLSPNLEIIGFMFEIEGNNRIAKL
jgi:hypothetical protein